MNSDFLKEVNKFEKNAIDELKVAGKVLLEKLKPPAGPYAIFHHQSHCIIRVKDISLILIRMHNNSLNLIELAHSLDKIMPKNHPAGVPFPKNVQEVMKKEHELTEYMRIDYEGIFLFGSILLDQWALFVAYFMGFQKPEEFSFYKLIEKIEKEGDKGRLHVLWGQKKSQMIWLDNHIRFYRNRFVTHIDRPWQRGVSRQVYGDSFQLFTPSPPGWIDDEEFERDISHLRGLLPGYNEKPPHDYWQHRRPLAQLEYLFGNIGSIENKKDRGDIQRLMGKFGGSTPDYKEIGLNLIRFIAEAMPLVREEAVNHIGKVNLGKPRSK